MPPLPAYRKQSPGWRRPTEDDPWIRTFETDDGTQRLEIIQHQGTWSQVLEDGQLIAIPGARDFTVAEYVGERTRRTRRYGEWIEVSAEVARSAPPLESWCQRECNSQLPAGGYRFAPAVWRNRSKSALKLPFLPELDDLDPTIRALAATERNRRILTASLERIDKLRREQIRVATHGGHSRRALGKLLGLSFGRIHQLLQD